MVYKLSYCTPAGKDKDLMEKLGCSHPNALPINWRSINESELITSTNFGFYTPEFIDLCRQMYFKDETGKSVFLEVSAYYYSDNTGIAFERDHNSKKINWYAFGCKHEYKSISEKDLGRRLFRCEHASKCSKCSYISIVDSSD